MTKPPPEARPSPDVPAPDDRPPRRSAGNEFERLVEIMRTLRSPDGCPWDREQTLDSLRPFVLEEAYEVIDAIESGDRDELRDEIGDLVFEGVFLAQLCAEEDSFTIADAVAAINQKLVRRHPHVFGNARTDSSTEVVEQWAQIKARERAEAGETPRLLDGIPRSLPGLLRAFEMSSRAATVGFDWPQALDVVDKIEEEVAELRHALSTSDGAHAEEEMGDLLFALSNLARKLGIEPESALRRANDKFADRFGRLEARLQARGSAVAQESLPSLETEWRHLKGDEG